MSPRVPFLSTRPRFREFVHFFGGSAVGLLIDLIGFELLVAAGLPPWLANGISSFLSISAVYILVTRFAFGVSTKLSTYLLFFAWYGSAIVVFSTLIQLGTSLSGWNPLAWKAISVPFSFSANYAFSRFLFLPKQRKDAEIASALQAGDSFNQSE